MFVVMRMQRFEFEQKPPKIFPFPIVFGADKMIGFLPCYETREDAKTNFPSDDTIILEARYKDQKKEGC